LSKLKKNVTKELSKLGVESLNYWTFAGGGFIIISPQEGELERVKEHLKEIGTIALEANTEELSSVSRVLTIVEEAGKVLKYEFN